MSLADIGKSLSPTDNFGKYPSRELRIIFLKYLQLPIIMWMAFWLVTYGKITCEQINWAPQTSFVGPYCRENGLLHNFGSKPFHQINKKLFYEIEDECMPLPNTTHNEFL